MTEINFDEYESLLKQGNTFFAKKLMGDALTCYKRALKLFPASVEVLSKLGSLYQEMGKTDKAYKAFRRVLELNEDDTPLSIRTQLFDLEKRFLFWDHWQEEMDYFMSDEVINSGMVAPFILLSTPMDNEQLFRAISGNVKKQPAFREKPCTFSFSDRKKDAPKLRLGFLCGDLRVHPTGYVIGEFFELIDREKFDVYLYDTHPDEASEPSKRIYATTPNVCSVEKMTDEEAAKKIYEDKIDILIDLNGHTSYQRLGVMTYHPAVAQGTFLGFLGTMGGIPGCRYNFADEYAVPPDQQKYYGEKIKYLEPVHRLIDRKVNIAPAAVLRSDLNFAPDTIVLCCFNNTYKYTPAYFDLWASILKRVPKAVLWFYVNADIVRQNIISEFEKRGIEANRLVFCNMAPHHEHLVRYQVADLLLDTEYYNAHTTAMEALYMGCPMITCPGKTFTSRAGGAMLQALGMPQMICKDIQEYEEKVVELCSTPDALKKLRQETTEKAKSSPLFDTAKFTRSFEKACREMYEESLEQK
ncbi:MAG: tetratricopeptide repeat protein [Alphaproteobacteria bacterium]